jgi:hypothetical protein
MMGSGVRERIDHVEFQVPSMLRKNRPSGSEPHAATRRRGRLMAMDLSGLAIVAGLLLPALAAAVWAIVLERRSHRVAAVPDPEPDWTVAGIQARLRFERATRRAGSGVLPASIPVQPGRDTSPDRLPWRLPRTLPPPRPRPRVERVPVIRFAFAPPDSALMRRILDGLRELD